MTVFPSSTPLVLLLLPRYHSAPPHSVIYPIHSTLKVVHVIYVLSLINSGVLWRAQTFLPSLDEAVQVSSTMLMGRQRISTQDKLKLRKDQKEKQWRD